jgi:hypothetical protein
MRTLILHPPLGGWQKLPWQFVLGIVLAALGGCLVCFTNLPLRLCSWQAQHYAAESASRRWFRQAINLI